MRELSIVGAGNVGKAIGKLLYDAGLCRVQQIVNRSRGSAERACAFIGCGEPITEVDELRLSGIDLLMISASDNGIEQCAREILRSHKKSVSNVVAFHCSGSLPSTILTPLCELGANIASVHPIKTFPDAQRAVESFRGTYCGFEGEQRAMQVLEELFTEIGALMVRIDSNKKSVYHAALVFICNYLFTILEAGLRCYEESGITREVAGQAVTPILRETIQNAVSLGPARALTGPIARGDYLVVQRQVEVLSSVDPSLADLYVALGKATITLAEEKGVASEGDLGRVRAILDRSF